MTTLQDPARRVEAITPSDTDDLIGVRGIYIGGDGNLAVMAEGNSAAVTHVGVKEGAYYPIRARRIMATGTTATSIVAWY